MAKQKENSTSDHDRFMQMAIDLSESALDTGKGDVCENIQSADLTGATIYSSAEPCPMRLAAI